jgi:hypothetical protein
MKDGPQRRKILKDFPAPEVVTLREGAQVMLTKNLSEKLVNGSIGRILCFVDTTHCDFQGQLVNEERMAPFVEFTLRNGRRLQVIISPAMWTRATLANHVLVSRLQVCGEISCSE